jgi:hypothetical protein
MSSHAAPNMISQEGELSQAEGRLIEDDENSRRWPDIE